MKRAVVPRSLAIDPFSLSAIAAEPLIGGASTPLSFFLLGATGRTGLPFLSQALARGHLVTIYVRNVSKLPTSVISHPHLRAFTGEFHEADKVALATKAALPDVVYIMLASERAPHTAVSTGTHSALLALRELSAVAAIGPRATPFISVAAWGLGPTQAYITGFFARMFVSVATALFWSKPLNDFKKQLAEVEEASPVTGTPTTAGKHRQATSRPGITSRRPKSPSRWTSARPATPRPACSVTSGTCTPRRRRSTRRAWTGTSTSYSSGSAS